MKGGLLQLATVGKADSILINKPQIFHFKKVYMKYTNFSIDNNSQVIGEKKFDTNFEISLRKNGDLLKDIFSLNDLETDTVRLNASTIKQLFEDTNYTLKDVREKKLVKPVALTLLPGEIKMIENRANLV